MIVEVDKPLCHHNIGIRLLENLSLGATGKGHIMSGFDVLEEDITSGAGAT